MKLRDAISELMLLLLTGVTLCIVLYHGHL